MRRALALVVMLGGLFLVVLPVAGAPAVNLFFSQGLDEFGQLPGWQLGGDGSNSFVWNGPGSVVLFTQADAFSQVFLGQTDFDPLPFAVRLHLDFVADDPTAPLFTSDSFDFSVGALWGGIEGTFWADVSLSLLLPKGVTGFQFLLTGRDPGEPGQTGDQLTSFATIGIERVGVPATWLLLGIGALALAVNTLRDHRRRPWRATR